MRLSPLLVFHICAATIGLLSGAAAMSFPKGSRLNGLAGKVLVISMLSMSATGAYTAFTRSQLGSGLNGVLVFYLVATAWTTARRRHGGTDIFDWGALLVILAVAASHAIVGIEAANT